MASLQMQAPATAGGGQLEDAGKRAAASAGDGDGQAADQGKSSDSWKKKDEEKSSDWWKKKDEGKSSNWWKKKDEGKSEGCRPPTNRMRGAWKGYQWCWTCLSWSFAPHEQSLQLLLPLVSRKPIEQSAR